MPGDWTAHTSVSSRTAVANLQLIMADHLVASDTNDTNDINDTNVCHTRGLNDDVVNLISALIKLVQSFDQVLPSNGTTTRLQTGLQNLTQGNSWDMCRFGKNWGQVLPGLWF